jgi:hypothetical protein
MSRDRSRDPPKTAAELTAELQKDPEYRARMQRREQQQRENAESYNAAAEQVLKDLGAIGFRVNTVSELRHERRQYRAAIPTLLRWLPRISDRHVKEEIIRTLSVPWAKPTAAPVFIDEFRKAEDEGVRWALANGLEVVADDAVFEDLVQLVRDKNNGKAREMLAVALGNMKDPRAVAVLIDLLGDAEIVGHAVMGLGKLKPAAAREHLEDLTRHPTEWIRDEALKALKGMKAELH